MVKVCFLNSFFRIDKVVVDRLREEMIKLAESDSQLEFWFFGSHDEFTKKAIQFIGELRSALSKSQIDIIVVQDPIKLERYAEDKSNLDSSGISKGIISRYVMAPRIEGKVELRENRFVEHCRKVERWMMEQCDIVYAYHYDNVPHPANTEIKRLRKKNKPKVISIYDPEFRDKIDLFIAGMEDRDGYVLQSLKAGKTYREIGEELGITINRVQQIANRATRKIMNYIRYDYIKKRDSSQ